MGIFQRFTLSMAYKERSIFTPSLRSFAFPQKSQVSFLNRSLRNFKKILTTHQKAHFSTEFRKTVE